MKSILKGDSDDYFITGLGPAHVSWISYVVLLHPKLLSPLRHWQVATDADELPEESFLHLGQPLVLLLPANCVQQRNGAECLQHWAIF